MIDGRQIRAARAMLGWSREELLQASGISMSALLRMEGALADSRSSTLNKVVKALSLAGIEFVTRDDGADRGDPEGTTTASSATMRRPASQAEKQQKPPKEQQRVAFLLDGFGW